MAPSETIHNPDRFMADFRQILSQGRKRIGLLVGAGASAAIRVDKATGLLLPDGEPLIPDVARLTKIVVESLGGGYLTATQAICKELGDSANIETILSRVRLLDKALGDTKVHGLDASGYRKLGQEICKTIGENVKSSLPLERNAFTELASWIGGTARLHPVEIFTTNYDLLFEEAFERARIPYFDGFSGGHAPFFDPVSVAGDDLPPRWVRLWKLHGSLGWAIEDGNVIRGRGRDATQLIYPDHLKYDLTQKQPYAALFERLRQFLVNPDTLLVTIGFSFGDAHICAVIEEALAVNANAAVFAFQYRSLENEKLACKLACNRPNLSVYAEDGAVIRGVPGAWQPGQMPNKHWADIRRTFWGPRTKDGRIIFTLGDFNYLARFCALAQASDLRSSAEETSSASVAEGAVTASDSDLTEAA